MDNYPFFNEVIRWPEVDPLTLTFKPKRVQRPHGLCLRPSSYFFSNQTVFNHLLEFIIGAYLDANFTESELYDLMEETKFSPLGKTFPSLSQSTVKGENFNVCIATVTQVPADDLLWSTYCDYVNLAVSRPDPQAFGGSRTFYPHFYFWPFSPEGEYDPKLEAVYRATAFATFLSAYFKLPVVRSEGSYYVGYGEHIYGIVRGTVTTSWANRNIGTDTIDSVLTAYRDWGSTMSNRSWIGLFLHESYSLAVSDMRSVPIAAAILYCGCLAAEKEPDDLIEGMFGRLRSEGLIPGISPYLSHNELRKLKDKSSIRLAKKVPRDIGSQLRELLRVVTNPRPPEPKFWLTLSERLIEAGVAPSAAKRFYTPNPDASRPPKPRVSAIASKLRTLIRDVEYL